MFPFITETLSWQGQRQFHKPPLQSTFTQFAASTGCKADVLLQILVQAAALSQREAGRWHGMNSFLGTEKSEGGGVQGANRLTGDLFEGEVDWRVKLSQRTRHKNVCSGRYAVISTNGCDGKQDSRNRSWTVFEEPEPSQVSQWKTISSLNIKTQRKYAN